MKFKNIIQFNPRNSILKRLYIDKLQDRINKKNRLKLSNDKPTLVCSNCTGGFLYHWLGLKFNSPFINLFLTNEDFLTILENWNEFLHSEIKEASMDLQYPVGQVAIGGGKILIHFMHYPNFETALKKWEERKIRMEKDTEKVGFMLTNWDGSQEILERFDRLPFKNKVVFTYGNAKNLRSTFRLKGLEQVIGIKQVFYTSKYNGERFIDQFDYVSFINKLK